MSYQFNSSTIKQFKQLTNLTINLILLYFHPAKPNHFISVPPFNRHGLDFGMHRISLTTAFNRNLASRQFWFFTVIYFFIGAQACFAGLFVVKRKKPVRPGQNNINNQTEIKF